MIYEDRLNSSLVLIGTRGTMYRNDDLLIEHKGQFQIISFASRGKVQIIEALSLGQRRNQPYEYKSLRELIKEKFEITVRSKTSICFQDERGKRTIIA